MAWSCGGILSGVVVRWDPQWRGRVGGILSDVVV